MTKQGHRDAQMQSCKWSQLLLTMYLQNVGWEQALGLGRLATAILANSLFPYSR